MSMNEGKVYVMKGDEVMAVANTSTLAISAESLAEPMEHSEDMAGPMTFPMGTLSIKSLNRDFRKYINRNTVRHDRFIRQIMVLNRNGCHFRVIYRCLWYGDRVPRKYRRAYGEVIRSMAGLENLREVLGVLRCKE